MARTELASPPSLKVHPLHSHRLGRVLAGGSAMDPDPVHVLVVEDDVDHAEIVKATLERQHLRVTVVGDGAGCFRAVASQPCSIILLDYSLPRMNGLEVLAGLRSRSVWSPVVMITAQGDERLAIESMKAGGTDFVVKTSGYLATLPTVLRKVLKQHELAVENERLHRETRRRLREAEALVALARTLTANLDLKALLEVIGGAAAGACDMDRCSIFDCHAGRARLLVSQFASGTLDTASFADWRQDEGRPMTTLPFLEAALRLREGILIDDPDHDPLVPAGLAPFQPRTLLVLPLQQQDVITGALVLDQSEAGEPITSSRLVLATTVASHVGLALDHARLYAESQRTLADLQEAQDRLVRGETLRALGELASGAAHHLNNLLAIVSGRCQLLLHTVKAPEVRRPLEIIERSARDGAEVVRRIQEFARTRQVEEPEPVDLNEVATDVVEMTRVRWHDGALAQGLTITVSCHLEAIPPVLGHPASLREVVTNLILNAIDALPQGGAIAVGTAADGAEVRLTVSDSGIGMSEEALRRAQEPFFTTKGVKSTGLGLSVNYGIIQRYHGDLSIASTVGQGTTVTIRLPAAPASAGDGTESATGAWTEQRRVLLVDDELEVREAIAELLQAMGHSVTHADGGPEALAKLNGGLAPDLVLTDLGMPGMTGRDLARTIKRQWPDLPVGLITGWGDTWGEEAAGTADFIMSKPINLDRLLQVIDRLAPRRRQP